jgi:hypothetical protein
MRRRRVDVDWYVDMSERLERRESLRKWVALAIGVSLALLLIALLSLYLVANQRGWLPGWAQWTPSRPAADARNKEGKGEPLGPLFVPSLESGDLRYPQLDGNGFPTSITHYFREFAYDLPPAVKGEPVRQGFTVNRTDERLGTVEKYRLRNIGTGDQYEFRDVPVKREAGGEEWTITEDGQRQMQGVIQAKMNVSLGKVLRSASGNP